MNEIHSTLYSNTIQTPLGEMLVVADEHRLHLLVFTIQHDLDKLLQTVVKQHNLIKNKITQPIASIQSELESYFSNTLRQFTTPITARGTSFQQRVWSALTTIPYGKTVAYSEIAKAIGNIRAVRAAASAIGKNRFAILVPCHRVISNNGGLGGYAGGLKNKKHLLQLEGFTL